MAKKRENSLNWDFLTDEEKKTLENMQTKGIKPCLAPIEIENGNEMQIDSLGIISKQLRTWRAGSEKRIVHPTPCRQEVADFLINDMRKEHRQNYRKARCKIPGTLKPLISCPDSNKCSECPYPKYRDAHQPDNLSWDRLIKDGGNERGQDDPGIENAEIKELLRKVIAEIDTRNPKYSKAVVLHFYIGYDVHEIAELMTDSESNVYFYISEAMKIGKAFKKRNDL